MNEQTDNQLLRLYAEHSSESAFAELARRHIDFVYSAAARMVRDPHLAEDVTQGVFIALAKSAGQLADRLTLCGWLHRTATNIAAQTVRTIERRRARELEAAMMSALPGAQSESHWDQIAPHLDAALGELSEADRDALLLRYFGNYDFRTLGAALKISDDAAQKRVSRAVDEIRARLARRGVAIGAGGLASWMTTHGVQSAPSSLAADVSAAAVLAKPAVSASAAIVGAKATAMTTFQKIACAAALAVAAGTGIYEARQASQWRGQNLALQIQQGNLAEQLLRSQAAGAEGSDRMAALVAEITRLKSDQNQRELLRLRGQVAQLKTEKSQKDNDPAESAVKALVGSANRLRDYLAQHAGMKIPELQLLPETSWLEAARGKLENDADFSEALNALRCSAKIQLGNILRAALQGYSAANDGNLPGSLADLQPYFENPVDDAILQRYALAETGKLGDVPPDNPIVKETAPLVDSKIDTRFEFKMNGYLSTGVRSP